MQGLSFPRASHAVSLRHTVIHFLFARDQKLS